MSGNVPSMWGITGAHPTPDVNDPFMSHNAVPQIDSSFLPHGQDLEEEYFAPINVSNDPFMSHMVQRPPHNVAEQPLTGTTNSSNMSGDSHYTNLGDLQQNPGMSGIRGSQEQDPTLPLSAGKQKWTLSRAIGEGDPERVKSHLRMMIFVPWIVFMWILLFTLVLQHYHASIAYMLSWTLIVVSGGTAAIGFMTMRKGVRRFAMVTLGMLCLIAAVAGLVHGERGWQRSWRKYWWMHTGQRFTNSTATTPAKVAVDASVINFWDESINATRAGTSVDPDLSAGFKDGHTYCAAPILSADSVAGNGLLRVNYWAIGIDCCQPVGHFHCDDSREHTAGMGVVMIDGGMPCPGCNKDRFQAAIEKAEILHNLVSVNGAIQVRWVVTPNKIERGVFWHAVIFFVVSTLVSLLVCFIAGFLMWYFGVGTGWTSEGKMKKNDASEPKRHIRESVRSSV